MVNSGQSASLKNNKIKSRKIRIKIPSDTRYAKKMSSRILGSLAPYKLDESDIFDIRLCVEEAIINSIVHGNRRDKAKEVKIAYWIEDDVLNVEVEDEGSGFNHKHMPDPTADDNIMKGSGRGVFLIKGLMDEAGYNESGNRLRMAKRLKTRRNLA